METETCWNKFSNKRKHFQTASSLNSRIVSKKAGQSIYKLQNVAVLPTFAKDND